MRDSHADLRTRGWKYCVYDVTRSVEAVDYGYKRQSQRRKGDRCRHIVHPKAIAKLGLPICRRHEEMFMADMAEDETRRKAMRAKYDPGPLPLETGE